MYKYKKPPQKNSDRGSDGTEPWTLCRLGTARTSDLLCTTKCHLFHFHDNNCIVFDGYYFRNKKSWVNKLASVSKGSLWSKSMPHDNPTSSLCCQIPSKQRERYLFSLFFLRRQVFLKREPKQNKKLG